MYILFLIIYLLYNIILLYIIKERRNKFNSHKIITLIDKKTYYKNILIVQKYKINY